MLRSICLALAVSAVLAVGPAAAEPKAVPQTRPDIKNALEALKKQKPRLPLPPLSDEEKKLGKRTANNGRMRALYLPAELRGGSSGRGRDDDAMTLDYKFKTMLFWIVSRANNCFY